MSLSVGTCVWELVRSKKLTFEQYKNIIEKDWYYGQEEAVTILKELKDEKPHLFKHKD